MPFSSILRDFYDLTDLEKDVLILQTTRIISRRQFCGFRRLWHSAIYEFSALQGWRHGVRSRSLGGILGVTSWQWCQLPWFYLESLASGDQIIRDLTSGPVRGILLMYSRYIKLCSRRGALIVFWSAVSVSVAAWLEESQAEVSGLKARPHSGLRRKVSKCG